MADISKTVAIIFEGDSSAAQRDVDKLGESLNKIGKGADTSGITAVDKAVGDVGKSAKITETHARELGEGLKKLAADAGVPEGALKSIDSVLLKIGGPVTGSAVVAAAAIAAFAIAGFSAGKEAALFKGKVENLTDSADKADEAFKFVLKAVKELEVDLGKLADSYARFLVKIDGTGISAKVAEDAFIGINEAVKGQGGDLKDAEKALDGFVDAAKDGSIDLKELEGKIADIPGGLRIFSEALGVSVEDLKLLAEKGELGKDAIERFAAALREQDYGSLTGVKDAFIDLWNTLREIALGMGAEGLVTGAFWLFEKAIRGITLAAVGGIEFVKLLGGTLGNVAFTLTSLDFAGFGARQSELLDEFGSGVESARSKFLGLKDAAEKGVKEDGGYKALADSIRKAGDEAEGAGKKSEKLSDGLSAAEKMQIAAAKAAVETEKVLAKQAETTRKAEEDVRKYTLELEKLASNERIKLIEANVKINIAGLEADTKRVEAAFKSIDSSIDSTGKVISSIFGMGMFNQGISGLDVRFKLVEKQLEKENKHRDEAFELQKKMTEATIREMEARTRSMESGNALIKIDGAGLKPHLEAFMWEMLRAIQVRVNRDGLRMLVGI